MSLLNLRNKRSHPQAKYPDSVLPLMPADLPQLYVSNHHRLNPGDLARWVAEMPGISQWHPASGEFVVATRWRNRPDIPMIQLLSSFNHETDLIRASIASAEEQGMAAYVTVEMYEKRRPAFYRKNGFELLEDIVIYGHQRSHDFLDLEFAPRQEFWPITASDDASIASLIDVDSAAFSWLWRNSRQEFEWWLNQPSVEAFVGTIDGEIASYYGATLFNGMAHLDRIAVHPQYQGAGIGRETLVYAMRRFASLGLGRVALSTQHENMVSRNMYEWAGFHRTPQDDFRMYGVILSAAPMR